MNNNNTLVYIVVGEDNYLSVFVQRFLFFKGFRWTEGQKVLYSDRPVLVLKEDKYLNTRYNISDVNLHLPNVIDLRDRPISDMYKLVAKTFPKRLKVGDKFYTKSELVESKREIEELLEKFDKL